MHTTYLISNKFKNLGWVILSLGLILGIILLFTDFESDLFKIPVFSIYDSDSFNDTNNGFFKILESNSIVNELAALFIIIGGFLVAFSKEKTEDEYITKLRLESLLWAFIVNYIILTFGTLFVFGLTFFNVLVFNMFTPLLFFIIRFHFLKFKLNHDEE